MGKCVYTPKWETDPKFEEWIAADKTSNKKATCPICRKSFDVSNMGEAALVRHMAGKKHADLVRMKRQNHFTGFFSKATTGDSYVSGDPHRLKKMDGSVSHEHSCGPDVAGATRGVSTIRDYATDSSVLSAEILWALMLIEKHHSYKSSQGVSDIFQLMFPDSQIASKFSCSESKSRYLTTFGIAPYFSELMISKIKSEDNYVLLFDESLNDYLQSKQFDVHVRFLEGDCIKTRYYTSYFLGHASADHVHEKLKECCESIGLKGILQLSMDGPNVNWKAFNQLSKSIDEENGPNLINIGSCGLHIMHNAFRAGSLVTDWDIEETFKSLYWLFHDSPARREDFTNLTDSSVFPKQFCKHRWIENVDVCERVLEIWPNIVKYVKELNSPSTKLAKPKNKSFSIVSSSCNDPLFEVKTNIFLSIARDVTPFLKKYQTDRPMLPFMSKDLLKCMTCLLDRIIKHDTMTSITSIMKLINFDITDTSCHKKTSDINIGFVGEKLLEKLKIGKKVSEKVLFGVKSDTRSFLIKLVNKFLEKAPVKFSLVRNLGWLEPKQIVQQSESCVKQLNRSLKLIEESGHVLESKCDTIVHEYNDFLMKKTTHDDFKSFDETRGRLDQLYYAHMANNPEYSNLWQLTKKILLLSHGQASVERGFSVNKEIIVENMSEKTVIAQRIITDHLKHVGVVKGVTITKTLLHSAAGARQKYHTFLDEEKRQKVVKERGDKRKSLPTEIDELKVKKKRVEDNMNSLFRSADEFSEKAERTGKLSFISKSNALRRSAKDKEIEIKTLSEEIDNKLQEYKN